MNKKLLILAGVLVALVAVVIVLYLEDIKTLIGMGEEKVVVAPPPKPKQDEIDVWSAEKVLEKTIVESLKNNFKAIGYDNVTDLESYNLTTSVSLTLNSELKKKLPKNLQKLNTLDFKISLTKDCKSNNAALSAESELLKKFFVSFYDNSFSLILPDSKDKYKCSIDELKNLGNPLVVSVIDMLGIKASAGGVSLNTDDEKEENKNAANKKEADEDEEEDAEANKSDAKSEEKKAEKPADKKSEKPEEKKADNKEKELSKNTIVNTLLTNYALTKTKGTLVKLTLTPKDSNGNLKVINYFVNKKKYLIEKIEQSDKITEITYDKDKPLKIKIIEGNNDSKKEIEY